MPKYADVCFDAFLLAFFRTFFLYSHTPLPPAPQMNEVRGQRSFLFREGYGEVYKNLLRSYFPLTVGGGEVGLGSNLRSSQMCRDLIFLLRLGVEG